MDSTERETIIEHLSLGLKDATDSRATELVVKYCRKNSIDATDRDISDMVSEAIRRRMVIRIKDLRSDLQELRLQVIALNQKVNNLHP